eukprot:scaffold30002_cov69-Phaeocystis_antarctica.AAC.1
MDGDLGLLRLAAVPVQAHRHIVCGDRTLLIEGGKVQRHDVALQLAQPTLTACLRAAHHAVAHQVVHEDAALDAAA